TLAIVAISCADQGWVFTRLPDSDAGFYAAAYGAAMTLDVIGFAEITASTVAMSDPERGWKHSKAALWRTAGLVGLGMLAAWVVAPFAIPLLYGSAFIPAVRTFQILVTGEAIYNIGRVAETALQSAGNPRTAWIFQGSRGIALIAFM